jgi:DNA-binding LacI/PurR family transcriptional regulator
VVVATRYDGMRARTSKPALTAVDLHLGEVGEMAIELLLEHLRGDTARQAVQPVEPTLVFLL